MKRRLLVLTLVSLGRLAVLAPIVAAQEATARPTVAIAEVDVAPGGWTLPPPQLGEVITQLLLDELVTSAQFHVLDGQWLVPESQLHTRTAIDRFRAGAAANHVDYLVFGTVTAFSTEQHARRGGGFFPRPFIAGGLSRQQTLTTVGVTFRVVDVRTGEIVTTTTAQGRGTRKATALGLLGAIKGLPLAAAGGSRPSMSRDAMLDEAVRDAVHGAAQALSRSATLMSARATREP